MRPRAFSFARLALPCALLAAAALASSCREPLFPDDFETTYVAASGCLSSNDHRARVRVFVSPEAADAYCNFEAPLPEGTVIVKVEHDPSDSDCSGAVTGYTVMGREAGASDETDWVWQDLSARGRVVSEGALAGCVRCHAQCAKLFGMDTDATCVELRCP